MNETLIVDGRDRPLKQRVRDAQQHLRLQQALLISHKAVSYTHLDVYKRQGVVWSFSKKAE